MVSSELLAALHKLGRAEKFQVIRYLIDELAVEENSRLGAVEYRPASTRLGDGAAARALLEALREDEVAGPSVARG